MTRRCSHCSNNGHNSRTCPSRGGGVGGGVGGGGGSAGGGGVAGGGIGSGVKLFGVRLTDGSIIKKSASMGNLSHYHSLSASAAASPNPSSSSPSAADPIHDRVSDGYVSDDPARAACSSNRRTDRKKGVPWTEEEHRKFLIGLQKLGKGDWRGIARNYVLSRTPTQVASHAQKHFIRQSNARRRKRRTSLFDMVEDMASDPPPVLEDFPPPICETEETINPDPSHLVDLAPPTVEFDGMDTTTQETVEAREGPEQPSQLSTMVPAFFSVYVPIPLWPHEEGKGKVEESHKVLKPIPVLPKEPVNVDELVSMSQLSLRETENGHTEPSPLSLNLLGAPSRPSAFHANITVSRSEVS